ncbi:hypothetical protein RR46_13597 [Papilio xuthus]|uniref:Uncharacterized protein n=1 Tax=Papilio xuthus TaxID=66420 RepID=A0A194PG62_PAPXU|nr:hypothetical protein RR46_13597 [Papilio xuthus]
MDIRNTRGTADTFLAEPTYDRPVTSPTSFGRFGGHLHVHSTRSWSKNYVRGACVHNSFIETCATTRGTRLTGPFTSMAVIEARATSATLAR